MRAAILALDERERLLELVDHEHELRLVVDDELLDGAQEPALVLLELLEQAGRRVVPEAQEGRLELLERICPREHLGDVPALGAGKSTLPEPRHETRPHDRRLAASARADDGEEARLRETRDEMLRQRLPAEEVLGVVLGEGPQPLVRVARLERSGEGRIEGAAEGEVAGGVLVLGPDGDHLHRLLEALEPHRPALDVVEPLDLAREMRDARADEHLAGPREGAEPGRKVEGPAAVAAVDGHRLAGVEPDPDRQRQARIGDRLRHEPFLQVGRRPQRLTSRIEDREGLVAA